MNFSILGSCVTRDAYEFMQNSEHTLDCYIARTSLASMYADSQIKLEKPMNIPGKGPFIARCVEWDLTKESRKHVKSDIIVMDFIDERFNLLDLNGTFCTYSNIFRRSNFYENLQEQIPQYKIIARASAQAKAAWESGAARFIKENQNRTIILHRALWADEYKDMNTGILVDVSRDELEGVTKNNEILNECYDFIAKHARRVIEINPPKSLLVADLHHKWGRAPFHFGTEYYKFIADQISAALTDLDHLKDNTASICSGQTDHDRGDFTTDFE